MTTIVPLTLRREVHDVHYSRILCGGQPGVSMTGAAGDGPAAPISVEEVGNDVGCGKAEDGIEGG